MRTVLKSLGGIPGLRQAREIIFKGVAAALYDAWLLAELSLTGTGNAYNQDVQVFTRGLAVEVLAAQTFNRDVLHVAGGVGCCIAVYVRQGAHRGYNCVV
jgi:hypothetical protein